MSGPPVPARGNLHNALAIALPGKECPQDSDKVLIDGVYKLVATVGELRAEVAELRRQLDAAQHGPDLFTAFDQEAS